MSIESGLGSRPKRVPTRDKEDLHLTRIRRAYLHEADALSDLALRAKAHWGYTDAFLEACRDELRVDPADVERGYVAVAEDDAAGRLLGFYVVAPSEAGGGELTFLYVDPSEMNHGVGRALFTHALASAGSAGIEELRLDADPHAAAFYRHMGARYAGEAPSGSIPGRVLPSFTVSVPAVTGAARRKVR